MCVYVCVHACIHAGIHVQMEARDWHQVSPLVALHLCFETRSLAELEACHFC